MTSESGTILDTNTAFNIIYCKLLGNIMSGQVYYLVITLKL